MPFLDFLYSLNFLRRSMDLALQCSSIFISSSVILQCFSRFSSEQAEQGSFLNLVTHRLKSSKYSKSKWLISRYVTLTYLLISRYVIPTDRRWRKWRGIRDVLLVLVRWYSSPSGVFWSSFDLWFIYVYSHRLVGLMDKDEPVTVL